MLELFILYGLAAHRLAFLWLTQGLFQSAREGISWISPFMRYAVNCQVCMSVWAGFIVYGLWNISWIGQMIVWALAISMFSAVFNVVMNNVELYGHVLSRKLQ